MKLKLFVARVRVPDWMNLVPVAVFSTDSETAKVHVGKFMTSNITDDYIIEDIEEVQPVEGKIIV